MRIGIFDTGKGGEYVAEKLKELLPEHEYRLANDLTHFPYGNRSQTEIVNLTDDAIQPLIARCGIIVIACNTATAAAIDTLRERYPTHHFIGYEPMIKPAAELTKSRRVVILATDATRQSARYRRLIARYGESLTIIEPDTTGWATRVEAGSAAFIDLHEVEQAVSSGADVVTLSCTHYLILKDRLAHLSVTVIEPTDAVAKRISSIIATMRSPL